MLYNAYDILTNFLIGIALTAETECSISKATSAALAAGSQTESSSTAPNLDAATQVPKLLSAIDEETSNPEDRYQGQVCAGWLSWVVGDYESCLANLPKESEPEEDAQADSAGKTSEWTIICTLKAAYLRADCLLQSHERKQALEAFQAGLPSLARVWTGQPIKKQLRHWAELYLTKYCELTTQALQEGEMSLEDANCVSCFRSWAKFWDAVPVPTAGGVGFKGQSPRRKVWDDYYLMLSQILENDLPYPTGNVDNIANDMSARCRLRVELKQAEAAYQALLLSETTFPKSDEEREEVEQFVRLVMKNWAILCGRGWREQDLGQGGRSSLSRSVLDILYGAATKTYHSTAILRFLFTVHLSVAEFDLAFKAFDSYIEIVKKGKARVDKTGHAEPSLDDDGTVLETMAQCIIALCQYGHQSAVEKARKLGADLEDWLAKLPQIKSQDNATPAIAEIEEIAASHPPVAPHIIALAWQAIGLAHAHWARVTYEAASRTEIQGKAIRCLRRSLATEYGRSKDIRSFFALGLLLAERRELTAAIETVKTALTVSKGHEEAYNLYHGPYWQERSLISVWHLLALLLSARQDYMMAARACEGALEQFKDPSVLFGKADAGFRSEHLKEAEAQGAVSDARRGLIDDMEDAEKESILEVKMTQLALLELLEGPDVAVNASFELLTLFSRLFGTVQAQSKLNAPRVLEPPKTSATMRTIKGSIFGNRDRSRPPTRQPGMTEKDRASTLPAPRPGTATSQAPAIEVTEENGVAHEQGRPRTSSSANRQRSASGGRRNSLKKRRDSSGSRKRASSLGKPLHPPTVVDGEPYFTPAGEGEPTDFFSQGKRQPSSRTNSFSRGPPIAHLNSYNSTNSKSTEFSELSADGTYASTNILPLIQFPKDKEQMQRTTILIKVWLMIAGFYRRAGMIEDAKGAIEEAQKLVQNLEAELAKEPAGSVGSTTAVWAEKKSIEDLWGDIWSEVSIPFPHLGLRQEPPFANRCPFLVGIPLSG